MMLQWRGIVWADIVNRVLQLMIIQIWLILVIIPCHKRDSEGLIKMFAWQIQTKCFSNVSAFMRLGSTTLPRPNYVNNFNAYQMQLTEGNINVLDVPIWASYLHCWKGMKWDFCEMFGSMLCVAWSCWHVSENMISYLFHIGNFF